MLKSPAAPAIAVAVLSTLTACSGSPDSSETQTDAVADGVGASAVDATAEACSVDQSWITSPSLPTEIPNNGATLCDFYQFSWQSLLYLMSPSSSGSDLRNFEVTADYPIFNGASTCDSDRSGEHQVFLRLVKEDATDPEFRLPEQTGQAGGGATIYDQNGNVAYYSMLVSEDMCQKAQSSSPTSGNLPSNAIEMKFAWKVLEAGEEDQYVTIDAFIGGATEATTLGMVGLHLAQSTPSHPEMVWASFEYSDNASNCLAASAPPASGFGFQSASCNACLMNPTQACLDSCSFNTAVTDSHLTGTPTEICRVFPEGTDLANSDNNGETNPDGTKNNDGQENIADVTAMNSQLVGPGGLLAQLADDNPLRVLANYQNLGAIWVTDTQVAASVSSNQRGSLQLENPVAETVYQGTLSLDAQGQLTASSDKTLNCFTCHDYQPGETASSNLSHVYSQLIPSSADND